MGTSLITASAGIGGGGGFAAPFSSTFSTVSDEVWRGRSSLLSTAGASLFSLGGCGGKEAGVSTVDLVSCTWLLGWLGREDFSVGDTGLGLFSPAVSSTFSLIVLEDAGGSEPLCSEVLCTGAAAVPFASGGALRLVESSSLSLVSLELVTASQSPWEPWGVLSVLVTVGVAAGAAGAGGAELVSEAAFFSASLS